MIFSWPHLDKLKAGESFRNQQVTWRRAYSESDRVRERFPWLEQLVLEIAFNDRARLGNYSAQMHSFCAGAKAFFAVACPRTMCLDGGFDLDRAVAAMLNAGETGSTGVLECQGWIKPDRGEDARCALLMHYRLEATYPTPAASMRGTGGRY